MHITPFGRYALALVVLAFVLALGVGHGVSGMLLVAAGVFVLAYESMRRPLVEQGLRRTPWFVPRLLLAKDAVTVQGIAASESVRFSDIQRARLIYQEGFDALMGIDDTLCLETDEGVFQVSCSSDGFESLMQALRDAGIYVRMVRARTLNY
ncbi:MAG: hypothetical protein H7Z43_04070 [Clostridia bacterium]|nr:hypothetical protein [Deltaproteobacteria bacterium]